MNTLQLQILLAQVGFSPGRLDDKMGPRTWSALNAWRRSTKRPNGPSIISDDEAAALSQAVMNPPVITPAMIKIVAPLPKGRRYALSLAEIAESLTLAVRFAGAWGARADDFVGQLAHESDGFKALTEYASGEAYENRQDLGNAMPGDGKLFRGRGWLQLTGRSNYATVTRFLRESGWLMRVGLSAPLDLEVTPERAAEPTIAALIAAWYWLDRGLNTLADASNIVGLTKAINGGTNGIDSRRIYVKRATEALGAA